MPPCRDLTPRQIVAELDRHIVGQDDAKRAVAIAIRNRWRRQQLPDEMRQEVAPKNILMIGPTGVGKTEIARRLAKLTGAPFIKVEATKYTEVGYYGRDVESMVRELVENAIGLVRETRAAEASRTRPRSRVEERLLDLLVPRAAGLRRSATTARRGRALRADAREDAGDAGRRRAGRAQGRDRPSSRRPTPMMLAGMGMEQMDVDLQGMFEKIMPKHTARREMTVAEARKVLFEQECEALIDQEKVNAAAIELAENLGIIFLDEIDKVVASEQRAGPTSRGRACSATCCRSSKARRCKPATATCGPTTSCSSPPGRFTEAKPSDLMPELQGRFPIRVELTDLTKDDFVRILTEPKSSLTKQYAALLETEGVELEFTDDAIEALADFAFRVNQTTQNIGARRLYTILERLLEELSFEAPDMKMGRVEITAEYVKERLTKVAEDEDLSRFIL